MKIAAIALVALFGYGNLPLLWEGVVGEERIDICTTRVWYERMYGGCWRDQRGDTQCLFVSELSIMYAEGCPTRGGTDHEKPDTE